MLEEKKINAPVSRLMRLPSLYKASSNSSHSFPSQDPLFALLESQNILLSSSSLAPCISQSRLSLCHPTFKRYDSKQTQIDRVRNIAKSNYLKCVTQQASEQLSRARMQSISKLRKKVQQHQEQEEQILQSIKKEEFIKKKLEKKRIRTKKKKIDKVEELQQLKKEKLGVKDKIGELQSTIRLYEDYERFYKEVTRMNTSEVELTTNQRIDNEIQVNPHAIYNNILFLEERCLKECNLKKIKSDQITLAKTKLTDLKNRYEPIKIQCTRKINSLRLSISQLQQETESYKKHLGILHYDNSKRGPFSIILSVASKFFKSKVRNQNKETSPCSQDKMFLNSLAQMQARLQLYLEEIDRSKKLDLSKYNRKQYQYLLGKIHPSRSGSNEDDQVRKF